MLPDGGDRVIHPPDPATGSSGGSETGKPGKILAGVEHGIMRIYAKPSKAMKPTGDQSRLDISVSWAPIRGSVPDTVPGSVSFPQDSFSFIEEAGRQLRVRACPPRPARYEGRSRYDGVGASTIYWRGRVGRIGHGHTGRRGR